MMRSLRSKEIPKFDRDRGPSLQQGADDAVWTINPWSASAYNRFDQFVRDLPRNLPSIPAPVAFLLSVLGYDCILNEADLIALAQSVSNNLDRAPGGRLTWLSDREGYRHTEARCLSMRTRLAANQLSSEVDWAAAMAELETCLRRIYPDAVPRLRSTALELALTDAKTWWYWHLPLCLYSHVRGLNRMPILDEQVLRRLFAQPSGLIIDSLASDSALEQAHDAVGDNLLAPPSNDTTQASQQATALIQSVFSVTVNNAGLRLATHLNSKELRDKLVIVTEMVRTEGWISAVLLSWAIHLLTVGSIRKANPAVSTLSAYVSSLLGPLAEALHELQYSPACYTQKDWNRLFEILRQHAGTGQHSAALASLHSWAVRTYGCDPMPDVMFQSAEETRVHANLVWPHEQHRALEYASNVSPDERVSHQVQVLLALGSGGLFRAGELPGLLTRDVFLDGAILYVHLNPGRGLHGGKSRAARRIVRIHDQALTQIVLNWRDRRVLESGSDDRASIFLFGDPHNPRQLYRVGHCVRLVNELLRRATGDDRVSFHSLRHANASARAFSLLTQLQPARGVSPLDELCFELGHSSPDTLWSTYFHLPEFALRVASDRIEAVSLYSTEETARWLGITPAAARQRVARETSESKSAFDLYRDWLEERLDADAPDFGEYLRFSAPRTTSIRPWIPDTQRDLLWVQKALAAVDGDFSVESLCLRLSCSQQEIVSLSLAAQHAIGLLKRTDRDHHVGLLLPNAQAAHALQWLRQQIAFHEFRFHLNENAQLDQLATYLNQHSDQSIATGAAQAWTVMLRHNVLSLHDPAATQQLLGLLQAASFPADSLVIRIQSAGQSTDECGRIEAHAKDLAESFIRDFGFPVRVERVRPRRGYPLRYLVICRNRLRPGLCAPSAAVRMHEIHGLFFSLVVFQSFRKERTLHE